MRILSPAEFDTQPWKNGGGVTQEIARAETGGRLDWRLSIAEVTSDGAFSAFPGLSRILTVIAGNGMMLDAADRSIVAAPLRPAAFSGDLAIMGRLSDGPIRDLNVIYDSTRISAEVSAVRGRTMSTVSTDKRGTAVFLCLTGPATANGTSVPAGHVAIAGRLDISLEDGAIGLSIVIAPVAPR